MKRGLYLGLVILVAVSGLVALLPPRKLALDLACQPVGFIYRLKASVQGSGFWKRQVAYLDREIAWHATLPDRVESFRRETDNALRESSRFREEIYRKHPELRPSGTEQSASELREQAEVLERKEMEVRGAEMREEIVRRLQACRVTASSRGSIR